MKAYVMRFAVALFALSVFAAPSHAASEKSTVNLALLDMSSLMGPGTMGYGMMGGMMAPGMMGPGMTGPGMMSPGMMGPGMMAPGTMGVMGMGMMSIRADHSSIKAGTVSFDVTNWSRSFVHEVLIVAVENPNAALPYNYAEAKVAEDQMKVLGEVTDLQPNASGTVDVALTPGSYLLICNIAGHYAAGMVSQLQIVP
jgi:uncharacterized cupredoxin-like copper-binding protein